MHYSSVYFDQTVGKHLGVYSLGNVRTAVCFEVCINFGYSLKQTGNTSNEMQISKISISGFAMQEIIGLIF